MTEDTLDHPDDETLRALSLGQLADAELAQVSAHLGDCPACCCRIDQLPADDRLVSRLQQVAASRENVLVSPTQRRSAVRALRRSQDADSATQRRDPDAVPPILSAPRQVGDYRIVREIGRGGMGVVYEAEQISLGRRVALKVLSGHVLGDRVALQRFRREAKAAAALHHTNIVPVFEVGQDGEVAFYAMQFIRGQGLERLIEELRRLRGPGRESATVESRGCRSHSPTANSLYHADIGPTSAGHFKLGRIAKSLLTGRLGTGGQGSAAGETPATGCLPATEPLDLNEASDPVPESRIGDDSAASQAAHAPTSMVLPGESSVSMVDSSGRRQPFFRSVARIGRQAAQGLAHAHARGIIHRDIKPSNLLLDTTGIVWITDFGLAKADDDGLTGTGDILGTLRYMAPERFCGGGDARADVYALGLTLYELLTIRPAFETFDRLKLIEQIKAEEPPRPRSIDSRIPADLETIVLKAIDKDPEQRYPTARALAEDLRRYLANEPIQARRASAVERYWRWARRNPQIALLGGVLTGVLVLATLTSLVAARQFHAQAKAQRALAVAHESERRAADHARMEEAAARRRADEANSSLRIIQDELRRTIYATRSNLALAAWGNNDVGGMRSLLDLMRPRPGETDYRGWEWCYLWQLAREDRLTLRAQQEGFVDVAFSPDGRTIAGLEMNGRIQLWDRQSGASRRTTGVTSEGRRANLASGVSALTFSPDGRSLAGPGPDGSLVLYAVDTGLPTLRFEGQPGAVLKLAWSPDGQTLIAAISAHVLRIWDARDGRLIDRFFGKHDGPVASVAFSPDGRTFASASYDRTVKLWTLEDRVHPLAVFKGHTHEVRAVAFSPDGRRIVSAGLDRTLRVWDAKSGAELTVIWGHTSSVLSLACFSDGERVVTGSADETVRVWDTVSGQELQIFKGHTDGVPAAAVSSDGQEIASASTDKTVRVWDTASPPRPRTLRSPSVLTYGGGVECLAFSPDGRWLVSGHDDHALRIWELNSGRPPLVVEGHTRPIKCVAFSPDGRTIASGAEDRTVRLWDAATGQLRITFTQHAEALGGLVFTPDGQTVLSGSFDRTIQAWDPATGKVRYVLRGHSDAIHDLALSPDGRTLASASYDQTCILWDLRDRRPRATLRGHTGGINAVAFGPAGRILATSSDDKTVRLWDSTDGSPRGTLEGHIDAVMGLAFNAQGRLASCSRDKTIRVWEPASGQTVLILKEHAWPVRGIKFSPDGRTLASASYDRTLKLWEAAPASILAEPPGSTVAVSRRDHPARLPGSRLGDSQ